MGESGQGGGGARRVGELPDPANSQSEPNQTLHGPSSRAAHTMTSPREDVRKILAILDESDCRQARIEFGDLKLDLRRRGDAAGFEIMGPHEKAEDRQASLPVANVAGKEPIASAAPAQSSARRKKAIPKGVVAAASPKPRKSASRVVKFMDTTLRDAHQSLWATRMTTAMMLPVAERLDRIGYDAIDLMGLIQFDVAVRYLKEDPWKRVRLIREKITRTPMQASVRSKSLTGFGVVPNDILLLWTERLIANGLKRIRAFDALADLDNIVHILRFAKEQGAYTVGALVYGHSPVHTDELYVSKVKELIERTSVDAIMLKDACGLLTPDRIRTLVPAMKKVMGKVPLELHSHCLTGLAPLVYLEGVKLGVDQVHTSIAPLANGPAQPATQTIARNLRAMGYTAALDDKLIGEVSEHFRMVTEQEGMPLGVPMEYDAFHFEHQVPGGMLTNFKFQLTQAGLFHRYNDTLEECARIRRELGWPIMVTPFAQLVGTQAVLNVIQGERYRTVPDEVKQYALGYYGKLLAPIEPNVLDRIIENGSKQIPLELRPLDPGVPGLRKKYPDMSDDERLLRYSFAGSQVDQMQAAGPTITHYDFNKPLLHLLNELTKRREYKHVYVQKGPVRLELDR